MRRPERIRTRWLAYDCRRMLQVLNPASPPQQALDPARLPPGEVEALYVHVPFCFHKCHYCDFYSITRQEPARMERFVELALREAELWTRCDNLTIRPQTI